MLCLIIIFVYVHGGQFFSQCVNRFMYVHLTSGLVVVVEPPIPNCIPKYSKDPTEYYKAGSLYSLNSSPSKVNHGIHVYMSQISVALLKNFKDQ